MLNYLLDMFDLMNSWSTHVQQLLLRKESIDNVVQTLSEGDQQPLLLLRCELPHHHHT